MNLQIIFRFFLLAGIALLPFCSAEAEVAETEEALNAMAEKVELHTLSNGVKVLFYRRGIAPVFSGVVLARVGGSDETPGATGISHMLEHMAFKGTHRIGTADYEREKELLYKLEVIAYQSDGARNLTPEQKEEWDKIQQELEKLWQPKAFDELFQIRGGVGLNAGTGKDTTSYYISLPRPAFEYWAWIESQRILYPVMRQFYKERDVVMEERRMRYDDDPDGRLYEQLLATAYTQHPYRYPVIGYESDLRGLTATVTEEFQKKYYGAENLVVAVVGDVDPRKDLPILEKYFGEIPSIPSPPRPQIKEPLQTGERHFRILYDASPRVSIAYHKPNYPHEDDAPLSVMAEILSGGRVSPLYKELVQKKRIVTSISEFEAPGNAYPNLMIFALRPRSPHTNGEAIKEFDRVLEQFKKGKVTDEHLSIAKRSIAVGYIGRLESNSSLASDLAYSELIYGDWRASLEWYREVMAVTAEDVIRVARQYLIPERRTIGEIVRTEGDA